MPEGTRKEQWPKLSSGLHIHTHMQACKDTANMMWSQGVYLLGSLAQSGRYPAVFHCHPQWDPRGVVPEAALPSHWLPVLSNDLEV